MTFRRLRLALTFIACAGACLPAAGASARTVPAKTTTVQLLFAPRPAFARPTPASRAMRTLAGSTPIAHEATVLEQVSQTGIGNGRWLRVRLPDRPNNQTGWLSVNGTREGITRWYVHVRLDTRHAYVYDAGRLVLSTSVVVGSSQTPTPAGHFFVTEKVAQPFPYLLGPWVLALNGYSNVLHSFDGGPGQIALHGQGQLHTPLGSADSNGCVHFPDSLDRWLAGHLPVGTPVDITPGRSTTAFHTDFVTPPVATPVRVIQPLIDPFPDPVVIPSPLVAN